MQRAEQITTAVAQIAGFPDWKAGKPLYKQLNTWQLASLPQDERVLAVHTACAGNDCMHVLSDNGICCCFMPMANPLAGACSTDMHICLHVT